MLDLESPPAARRGGGQEKRLRKRRELDALVRDAGGGRRRRAQGGGSSGAAQELLGDGSSSDCSVGEARVPDQEGLGVVWRGVQARHSCTPWGGMKWGLGASTVFLLVSITVWLHVSTRFELDVVRRHVVRGELLGDTFLGFVCVW